MPLKRLYPEKLRTRMTLLTIGLVCVCTVLIAYLVEKQGKDLLFQEKESKLFAITHMLDLELGDQFSRATHETSPAARIASLNQVLSPRIEALLSHMPNVGAGYYHRGLDAIVVYAPAAENGDKVGVRIADHHPGRRVMASGQPLLETGEQVRGNIMNAMLPIIRQGEVLGYIWANERVEDIDRQTMALDKNILLVSVLGIMASLLVTTLLSRRLGSDIDAIKTGLQALQFDLHATIPPLKGEMNEIVEGVNHLAISLSQAKSLNEMILESTVDGVITIDTHGVITMMNPAAQRIIGCDSDKVLGKPYQTIIEDQNFQSPLLDTLESGQEHVSVEIDFPAPGKVCRLSSSSSLLRNGQGETIGAVVIFKDLTEQKEMQRIVQQAERLAAVGELMAGVAHEIRNPLTAVRGFVQCLKQETSGAEKAEFIAIILKEVDSINKVIEQLLDFSRPPRNFFVATALNELIHETLILVKSSASSEKIEYILKLEAGLEEIYLDRELVKQVLLNLLINAVQAIEGPGKITIATYCSKDGRYQQVEIHDTGPGIDIQLRERFFSPFFTTKPSGTGLGLAIAYKIVSSHNGSLTLDNHPQGGARVVISLPRS